MYTAVLHVEILRVFRVTEGLEILDAIAELAYTWVFSMCVWCVRVRTCAYVFSKHSKKLVYVFFVSQRLFIDLM